MKIAVGADHGGFILKQTVVEQLKKMGHSVVDCGADTLNPADDYPDFSRAVGQALQRGDAERGVLICGSGVGAAIAAIKMRGVRACVCHDTYSAHQGVEHDDMNVLTLGSRVIGPEPAFECAIAFLEARFSGEPRHVRRLDKVLAIEARGIAAPNGSHR